MRIVLTLLNMIIYLTCFMWSGMFIGKALSGPHAALPSNIKHAIFCLIIAFVGRFSMIQMIKDGKKLED